MAPTAVDLYAIDINFDAIFDPEEKRYFRNLPTIFALSDEQVNRLREMAGRLLRESPDYERLLRDLATSVKPLELLHIVFGGMSRRTAWI